MEDVNLRLAFHRALDPVAPPAPWLGQRVREEIARRRRETVLERLRRRPTEFAWLMPAVAVIVMIALLIAALVGHRITLPVPVPVFPHAGAAVGCPTWGYIPGGPNEPSRLKMMSTTVGWAPGDLRTTDGGANWHDMSPKELRSGEPYLPGQQTVYPPNYNDFFLDANHAWLVRSFQSDSACVDHYTVFRTSDGGRTWQQSDLQPGNASNPVLSFLDSQHGWLFVSVPNPQAHATPALRGQPTSHTLVFKTIDGGRTWRQVSSAGPSCPAVVFVSPARGFSGGAGQFGSCPTLSMTNDGGATWSVTDLHGTIGPLAFFDPTHGAVNVYGDTDAIYVTADGGRSWQKTASAQSGATFAPGGFEPYAVDVWFEDQHDFWLFTTQPGWFKGGPPTDWIYHSADGGATWQLVQPNTAVGSVQSVSFLDPRHWFVLQTDANGAIQLVTTSDGGHTWTQVQVHVS